MADNADAEQAGRTERLTFLYAAINDVQGTIRAIDLKLNVLIVILIIPLASLKDALPLLGKEWCGRECHLSRYILPVGFALVWTIALIAALRGLSGIAAPQVFTLAKDKNEAHVAKGVFYLPGVFKIPWTRIWWTGKHIRSQMPLPEIPPDLDRELRFEQAKLAYIRDVKLLRAKVAYAMTIIWVLAWLLIGIANFSLSK